MDAYKTESDNCTLTQLLNQSSQYGCEYRSGLSDHLPMLLHSMHALGATDARLEEYAAQYRPRLEPASSNEVEVREWQSLRGHFDAYDALANFFAARIAREGRDAVLRDVIPSLLSGVAAGAFHGLIRCGHAIAANHDGELARGLAYWTVRYQPLVEPSLLTQPPSPSLTLELWLDAAHKLVSSIDTTQKKIIDRMKAWSHSEAFASAAPQLCIEADTLREIARLAAALYVHTGNFTVLHMLTSTHAMHVLRPHLHDPEVATRCFSIAVFAALRAASVTREQVAAALAMMSFGFDEQTAPLLPWSVIADRAIASEDDHVAKIVYSSKALFQLYGSKVFHAAAMRGVADS